jgi:hypothetical protein
MDQPTFVIPDYDQLDPDAIEVFLDVDLDEFTILFYGRDREHVVHPMNDILSYLLDIETGDVVGISLARFGRQVLQEHPYLREDIPMATVLFGGFVGHLSDLEPRPTSTWGRVVHAVRAGKRAWDAQSSKEPIRSLMRNLPAMAQPG